MRRGKRRGSAPEELSDSLRKRSFSETIEKNMESARENEVFGVPTLYLGGLRIHGIQPVESYRKLIEKELRREKSLH